MHVGAAKDPEPVWLHVTVPVGAVGVPDVSVTVAVQVETCVGAMAVGAHTTDVLVECIATPTATVTGF